MLSAPLMPYLLVGMCFKNLSVLITEQTGQLLNAQFIDQLLLNQWDYSSWRLQMRTQQEKGICCNKGNCKFYVYLPVFSSDTNVRSKRKAEKAEIHSGSGREGGGVGVILMKGILEG